MSTLLKIVSSQYKHLPGRDDSYVDARVISKGSMLKNEPFSFQVLYKAPKALLPLAVTISANTQLPVSAYRVDYVPVMHVMNLHSDKTGYESNNVGLFPDILMPRPANPEIYHQNTIGGDYGYFEKDTLNLLNATDTDFQSVWFTVNPDSVNLETGIYSIPITLSSLNDNSVLAEETITLEIIDAQLPEHSTYYTNWFHVDCVCDMFQVELYSDKFYSIFDEYVTNMIRHRQNVILLPSFTPPLDTPVGRERMNVQLVEIDKVDGEWKFGFNEMRKFVRHSLACGIKYFEHCHIFSQWGATGAPNIYSKDGTRIFDCTTDAAGEEYVGFIRAYLKAFFEFAREEGISDSLLFHISDEPAEAHKESYRRARENIQDLLQGHIVADAMCSPKFYEEGLVDHPIAFMRHADEFDGKCPTLWLYYTGYPLPGCTNRMITNTSARTRVLGLQLYRYNAIGFLDWAYNYYYDRLSAGCFDPKANPHGYKMYPGITYLAYPITCQGDVHVVPSIREKLMAEAFDDLRALKLLESMIGRKEVLAICESKLGTIDSHTDPSADALYELREIVNYKIKENL